MNKWAIYFLARTTQNDSYAKTKKEIVGLWEIIAFSFHSSTCFDHNRVESIPRTQQREKQCLLIVSRKWKTVLFPVSWLIHRIKFNFYTNLIMSDDLLTSVVWRKKWIAFEWNNDVKNLLKITLKRKKSKKELSRQFNVIVKGVFSQFALSI